MEKKITSAKIRKYFPIEKKHQPCFICKKHSYISHSHHISPVSEVAEFMTYFPESKQIYSTATVELCPTCHTYVHLFLHSKNTWTNNYYLIFYEWLETKEMREQYLELANLTEKYKLDPKLELLWVNL